MLNQPFFKSLFSRRVREIERATALSKRLRALDIHAGYIDPPIMHDFKTEGLF